MKKNEMYRISGSDRKKEEIIENTKLLLEAVDLVSMIPSANTRVLIKPNLVTPTPADYGATTHVEVVEGLVSYLQEHGFHNLVIAESSWVGDKTSEAFEYCGYNRLSGKYGVPLVDIKKTRSHVEKGAGMKLHVSDCYSPKDFLINVPVLKGHCQTNMTCALKNMKGLIPDSEKRRFHTMGLHKPIAHLAAIIRQDFILVDHICGDPDFEEGGNPKHTNWILAGADPVLVDTLACRLLNLSPEDVQYVGLAEDIGAGSTDLESALLYTVHQPRGEVYNQGDNTYVITRNDTWWGETLRTGRIDVLDIPEAVDSCSACYAGLIAALMRLREEGYEDYLPEHICIGQGWRGKTGDFGVGNCTKDFMHSIPGCPPGEDAIYEEIKKMI